MLISFAISIMYIIARWKLYEKLGAKGWASLIPVYSQYVLLKSIGINTWWILINCGLPIFQPAAGIYLTILTNVSLANAFGKKTGFVFGLIFLPIIFIPILAFDNTNKFLGKNPMEDMVFKKLKSENLQKQYN